MRYEQAGTVINDAAVELGLQSVSDPFDSTDPNMVLLCSLLKSSGRALMRDHSWSHLRTTYSFFLTPGITEYALPESYVRIIDNTAWDRTEQRPLRGPIGPELWAELQAAPSSGVVGVSYRIFGGKIHVYPTPAEAVQLAFEYVSRYWVGPSDATTPADALADTVGSSTDMLFFDSLLLVRKLKVLFREAKGFDSSAARADYNETLSGVLGGDGAAPTLRIAGGGSGTRIIGPSNIPETGFGG